MNSFEAYHLYNSLKLHFISEAYDYFKYGGKIRCTPTSYERRKDKFFYEKLAKLPDPVNFIVANLVDGDRAKWIGGLVKDAECKEIYQKWLARQQSISYHFKEQLDKLLPDFDENLKTNSTQHPFLLKELLGNRLTYETVIILNDLCNFFPIWDKKINDVMWPTIRLRCEKYKPFIKYDKKKMKEMVLTKFSK
jgi:hypothetical protein